MRLTDEQVASYQAIHFRTLGQPISKEDARAQGLALLRLVRASQSAMHPNNDKENYDEAKPRDNLRLS